MKTLKRIGRHCCEVWEDGKMIDRAHSFKAVWDMKVRHGLLPDLTPSAKSDGCDNLPTGFEEETK